MEQLHETTTDKNFDDNDSIVLDQQNERKQPVFLRDIEPIRDQTHVVFDPEKLNELVEPPVLKACQILFEKGVRTSLSGANCFDLERGIGGWIVVDYDSLSDTNKRVAEEMIEEGKARKIGGKQDASIMLVVKAEKGNETTVEEVETSMMDLVSRFTDQPPVGFGAYTLDEMKETFGLDPSEDISIEQLSKLSRQNLYYNEQQGLVYLDKETYENNLKK